MPRFVIYLVIAIIFALIFILFSKLKKNFIIKMSKILYADNNPDMFIKELGSFKGKLFINKKTRLFRLIDAYALKQDSDSVVKIFKELESKKLSFGQKVSLFEKVVNYYVQIQKYDEATIANDKIQELSKQVEIQDLQNIAKDCQALIDIYINKDGSLATIMADNGDKANIDSVKGTYYFRAAKCYYYRNDNRMIEKYLEKANKYLINTSMKSTIEECIKDHNKLDIY